MTLELTREDVRRLVIVCSNLECDFSKKAADDNPGLCRERDSETARMWGRIHNELKNQLDAFDNSHNIAE